MYIKWKHLAFMMEIPRINPKPAKAQCMQFEISHNFEFYCFLKAHLPAPFRIVSEPSKNYYSEWHYNYIVYNGDQVFKEFSGDYRELTPGSLIDEAKKILEEATATAC